MKIRIGPYTVFNEQHLAIKSIRDNDENVLLRFEGEIPPSPKFEKSKHEIEVSYLNLNLSELKNAYWVQTYGIYKGFIFEIFPLNIGIESMVTISTSNVNALEKLNLAEIKKGLYAADLNIINLEKVWEERKPSNFNLPMPEGLETRKEIKL